MRKITIFRDNRIMDVRRNVLGCYNSLTVVLLNSVKGFLDRYPHETFDISICVEICLSLRDTPPKKYLYEKQYKLSYGCLESSTIKLSKDWKGECLFRDLTSHMNSIIVKHMNLLVRIRLNSSVDVLV